MSEAALVQQILLALGCRPDCRVWRQNTGKLPDPRTGRWVSFGLRGSGDITGILQGGRRLEIEAKTPTSRLRPEQLAFGRMISSLGGVYIVARAVGDAVEGVDRALGERAA